MNSLVSRGGYRAASFGTEDVGKLRAKSEQFVVSPVGAAHMKGEASCGQESRRSDQPLFDNESSSFAFKLK
jgi:hypothetical protein